MSEPAKSTTEDKKDDKKAEVKPKAVAKPKADPKTDPKITALEAKVDELMQIIDLLAINSGMGNRVATLRDKISHPEKYKGDKLKKVS